MVALVVSVVGFASLATPVVARIPNNGTLVVVKDASPTASQTFSFTGPSGSFSLTGLGDASSQQSFSLAAGNYTVAEVVPGSWELADIDCSNNTDLRLAPNGNSVNAQVVAGQTTTCTFSNVELGSITVVLDATPNSPDVFDLTGTLGAFTLTDDGTSANTRTFDDVTILGSRSIGLTVPPGWELTASSCSGQAGRNSNSNRVLAVPDNPLTPDLLPGGDITCTFAVRDDRVDLTLVKELLTPAAVPGGQVEWRITATNAGPGDAGEVPLTDSVPAGVSGVTWSCAGSAGGECDNDTANETGSGDLDEEVLLPAGASVVFLLVGTLSDSFQGELVNSAALDLSGLSVVETSPNDNDATARGFVGTVLPVPGPGPAGRLALVALLALLGAWALRRMA